MSTPATIHRLPKARPFDLDDPAVLARQMNARAGRDLWTAADAERVASTLRTLYGALRDVRDIEGAVPSPSAP